jgi:osmoprotectant transport system permease protein
LGKFILQGLRLFFSTATLVGAVLSVVLALAVDGSLLAVERSLTPWARPGSDRRLLLRARLRTRTLRAGT